MLLKGAEPLFFGIDPTSVYLCATLILLKSPESLTKPTNLSRQQMETESCVVSGQILCVLIASSLI